jgi:Zn-dependent protease/predicted transcriptional regulator
MRSVRVGRVFGIDVHLDPSLLALLVLLVLSLYSRFGSAYPETPARTLLVLAAGGGVLFLASVFVHELSHSLVAVRRGLTVRRIRLFIFGGVSEIEQDAGSAADEFAVAFAGPAASIVTGVALLATAWPFGGPAPAMLRLIGLMNLLLAVFNLLPGLPLDGGRVLRALVWRGGGDRARATRIAVGVGRALGAVFMAAGIALVAWRGDLAGVWLLAIGWFLYQAATSSAVRERLVERTGDATIGDVMRRVTEAADGDSTVARVVELFGWDGKLRALPVVVDGRVRGIIDQREVDPISDERRASTRTADVMTPIGPHDVVDADVPVLTFLSREAAPARRVVVVSEGRVVGIVTAQELAHLFQ